LDGFHNIELGNVAHGKFFSCRVYVMRDRFFKLSGFWVEFSGNNDFSDYMLSPFYSFGVVNDNFGRALRYRIQLMVLFFSDLFLCFLK